MKYLFVVIGILISIPNTVQGQISNVVEKFPLPSTLSESSGAIFFNSKLITHNDSGNANKLYELDTISGSITREVIISNATNVDWEDITQDETSIFIGDIGNNSGNRTNLKIYKISKTDYSNTTNVTAEVISFSYADQVNFAPNTNNTEWDAEALISFDANNLIVFTKNWVSGTTKGYLIPKTPGTYAPSPLPTTLSSEGLITGATLNPSTGKLYLIGYSNILQPFVWVCENFNGNDVFSGTNTKTNLSSLSFEQAEAITYVDDNRYLVTSESFSNIISDDAKLIAFSTNDAVLSSTETGLESALLYPNPVTDYLYVKNILFDSIEIYDSRQVKLYEGTRNGIDMSRLSEGFYIVKINSGTTYTIKKILKK
ncbi:MAG: T9SS type A sorting domain-containing protein [Mangrovimonas sp.]|nr:T9SS type A sorting domain-containing protein [Mangrovimonas sp.]